jgi:hypothetical protein
MVGTVHVNVGLTEWQIMPDLAICYFLLCSEYVTTN